MRNWKCISTPQHQLTVGKIYETDDNGYGLIDDDGNPYTTCAAIFEFSYSKFEELTNELTNEEVLDLFIEATITYSQQVKVFGKHIFSEECRKNFTSAELVERLKAFKKLREKTSKQLKIEEIEETVAELNEQLKELKEEL